MRQRIDALSRLASPLRHGECVGILRFRPVDLHCGFKPRLQWHSFAGLSPAYHPEQPPLDTRSNRLASTCQVHNATNISVQIYKRYSSSWNTKSSDDHEALPSRTEGRRSHLSKRFSNLMDHAQANIFIAGQRLNDLTGYSGIEALKQKIDSQEKVVEASRTALRDARAAYSAAISTRASSQREVNQLLQRKHSWSPEDLERFTSLYRSDHANEQSETNAREDLSRIENESEEAAANLNASILARYHEEQIWSDKIRRMSTWGTWGLMGVNVLLFFIFQVGVEPWRRKRLVKGFEEKVKEALEGAALTETTSSETGGHAPATEVHEEADTPEDGSVVAASDLELNDAADQLLDSPPLPAASSIVPTEAGPGTWFGRVDEALRAMFSEDLITVRRFDITTAVLEGAAAGIVLVGAFVLLLRPR